MIRTSTIVIASVGIIACGGGGSSSSDLPLNSDAADICTPQTQYFESLAGTRTGQVGEPVVGNEFCVFDVELVINNDPDPSLNCEVSGEISDVGTQLVVDAGNSVTCDSATGLAVRVGQTVAVVTVNPTVLTPPLDILFSVDGLGDFNPNNRVPFLSAQTVGLNEDFSIQVGDQILAE